MKKNRINSWKAFVAALICALSVSGCRLALDERTESAERFVGISVILSDGGELKRNEPHEPDGQLLISPVETNETGDAVVVSDAGEWFSDVRFSYHVQDDGEERNIEGTLYVCPDLLRSGVILMAEEVYQRADGSLYAINGGHNYSGSLGGLKIDLYQTHDITNEQGDALSESCRVTLQIKAEARMLSAEIIEMDADNREIRRHTLADQEEIPLSSETQWALLSEVFADGTVRRTALNLSFEDDSVEIRRADEQGICIPCSYQLTVQ